MSGSFNKTVFETHKIGNVYYPTLPDTIMERPPNFKGNPFYQGRVPTRFSPSPVFRFNLSEQPNGEDLRRFGKRPYQAPSRMVPPTFREFMKRGAGRFNYMFQMANNMWDLYDFVQEVTSEAPVTEFEDYPEVDVRLSTWVPQGWDLCHYSPWRAPGQPAGDNFWYPFLRDGPMATAAHWGGGCAGEGASWATKPMEALDPYGGWYTQIGPDYTDFGNAFRVWRRWDPNADPNIIPKGYVTPFGEAPTGETLRQTYPVAFPRMGPEVNVMPQLRPIGVPSGFPDHVPWAMIPLLRNFPGIREGRYDDPWGEPRPRNPLNPEPPLPPGRKPPLPPLPPKRPPPGKKERKRAMVGRGILTAGKAVLNTTLEACDAIDAVWKALPREHKWTPGLGRGKNCYDKGMDIYNHFGDLDIDEALMNLARMYIEDKMYGKVFAMTDKAGRNLSKHGMKVPGWKIDQPITSLEQPFPSGLLSDIEGLLGQAIWGVK